VPHDVCELRVRGTSASLVYSLFMSDGLAASMAGNTTFEQAGRDFKKLLI